MRKLKKIQIAKICIMIMAVSAFAGVSMGDVAYAATWRKSSQLNHILAVIL